MNKTESQPQVEDATFAAGCFWGVEERFARMKGVLSTEVGYTGGHTEKPTYEEVCSGTTGHAEGVHLTFDPEVVSYEELVRAFFDLHDPTALNRQGPDVGSQYRGAIFVHSARQEEIARKVLAEVQEEIGEPVATEIVSAKTFWRAEEYHQRYFEKNGGGVCH